MNALPGLAWVLVFPLACAGVQAAEPVGAPEGPFGFRANVEGEQFEARFGRFAVVPRLDAERLPTGFSVEVDMFAIDSGNSDLDTEMQTAEWFDTAAYPVATFLAQDVAIGPQGGYVAKGELEIKGVRRAFEVPFTWQTGPRRFELRGEAGLDRRWFGVGPGDESSVAARVTVFFDLSWGGR